MDVSEQIKSFGEFIEQNYHDKLLEDTRLGNEFLVLDFIKLSRFNPELADVLLEQPEDTLKAAELAVLNSVIPLLLEVAMVLNVVLRGKAGKPTLDQNMVDVTKRLYQLVTKLLKSQQSDVLEDDWGAVWEDFRRCELNIGDSLRN